MADTCELLPGYIPVGMIGYGASATVHLAQRESDRKLVCVKKIKDDNVNVNREIENLRKCKHANICELIDVIHLGGVVYIVMEYARGGCLSKWLMNRPANVTFTHKVFCQLIDVLEYLHTEFRMMHRDIKLDNIMLDEDSNVKLIDFGFSKELEVEASKGTACGSPAYVAPEVIKRDEYGFPADIWAAGVVLYVMVVGQLPFSDTSVPGILKKIVEDDLTFPSNLNIDVDLQNLLFCMLDKDPRTRITIRQIKESRWVKKLEGAMPIQSAHSLNDLKFKGYNRMRSQTNEAIRTVLPAIPQIKRRRTRELIKVGMQFKPPLARPVIPCNILFDKKQVPACPILC